MPPKVSLGLMVVASNESVNVFKPKSAVTAAAETVGLEQLAINPLSDSIGVHM